MARPEKTNQPCIVSLRKYPCNRGGLLAAVCARISHITPSAARKNSPARRGDGAGRIDRRQGIGGGAAPIGVRLLVARGGEKVQRASNFFARAQGRTATGVGVAAVAFVATGATEI